MSDEPKAPAMQPEIVIVKFGATVPMQDYGNFTLEVMWEGKANPADTLGIANQLRLTVGQAVLPVVQEQILRAEDYGRLDHVDDIEKYLMGASRPFFWLRTVCPELEIPALAAVKTLHGKVYGKPGNGTPAPAQVEDVDAELAKLGIPVTPAPVAAETAFGHNPSELGIGSEKPSKPKNDKRQPAKPGAGKINQTRGANRL